MSNFTTKYYRCTPKVNGRSISKLVKVTCFVSPDMSLVSVHESMLRYASRSFFRGNYLVVTQKIGTPYICSDVIKVY